jgi:hypothetical protein
MGDFDPGIDAYPDVGTAVFLLDAQGDHETADLLEIASLTYDLWNSNFAQYQYLAKLAVETALLHLYTQDVCGRIETALNDVLRAVLSIHRMDIGSHALPTRLRDTDTFGSLDACDDECLPMGQTRSDTRDCGSGPSLPTYTRYGDDCLAAGEGGPERAAWAQEALEQQYAEIGVTINHKKSTNGSLYDGFKFLGIFWRVDRDTGRLELDTPYGQVRDTVEEVRNEMWKTFGQNPRGRVGTVQVVHDSLIRRTQYLRRCGADDGEIWSDAYDCLMRLADWYDWPI